MQTETVLDEYKDLDIWPTKEVLSALIKSNERAVQAVNQALPSLTNAAEALKKRLAKGGRLFYVGAGTSGRLAAQDAAELLPTFGFDQVVVCLAGGHKAAKQATEYAEDDEKAAIYALETANLNAKDCLIAIAASGNTPYTVAAIREANAKKSLSIGIANNQDTALLKEAEHAIFLDTGPEVLAGSTRLAAGTAQKIALNALSTSVLVGLGGAYHNLMVGMQPLNAKLHTRAIHIVSAAAQVSNTKAKAALEMSNWQIREAIVMLITGLGKEESAARLARCHNRIREAIKDGESQ